MSDDYFKLQKQHAANKARNEAKYKELSKKRLLQSINTKMKTVMIGSLARFEQNMGHLWGAGKRTPLTPEESAMAEIWQKIRTEILDLGNNNMRAAEQEIAQYSMSWERNKTELIIIKPGIQGEENE
jgi:hypothetical protein